MRQDIIMSIRSSNHKNATTIRDVARVANVSISTVSRVLNDHPHVDEDTRQAVWKIVSELEYPMSKVRGQTQKTTGSMAFISHVPENDISPMDVMVSGIEHLVVQGSQNIFKQRNMSTLIHKVTVSVAAIENLIETHLIKGLIFLGGIYNHDVFRWLKKQTIPFVTAGSHAHPLHVNAVMANYIEGMCYAVNHLVERGCKRICLVNGPTNTNTSAEKYKGLRLSLSLNNLPFDDFQVTQGDTFDSESGYISTLRLLAQPQTIDAIIYGADSMALGGLKAIREAGRKVPSDISVIGFHNYEYARFADPALTTIGFDMQMMGRLAAQRLCALMDGVSDDCHVITVPTTLIVRDST